jgi:host factor-I protein
LKVHPSVTTITEALGCGILRKKLRTGGAVMKDTIDTMPVEKPADQDEFANRKLIRPALSRNDHNHTNHLNHSQPSMERRDRPERSGGPGKKTPPPETTNAENFYYQKQMQSKTPMVVVLRDGEEIHGLIEWYDSHCIKLNRNGLPNLMIYKPAIKYMYKESEK